MRQFLNRKSVTHEITLMSAKQNPSLGSIHQGPGLRPTRYLTARSSIRAPTGDRIARERRVMESRGHSASHTRAVLSAEAVAIRWPSGPCSGPVPVSVAVVPELGDLLTTG